MEKVSTQKPNYNKAWRERQKVSTHQLQKSVDTLEEKVSTLLEDCEILKEMLKRYAPFFNLTDQQLNEISKQFQTEKEII